MATTTESELRRMITSHALQSTRAGWRDWCQRLMWNIADLAGGVRETYPTATAAYHASRIESRDASLAPPGAVHYWHEPYPDGHVGFDLDGGGTRVLMATSFADDWWGNGAGVTSIRDYTNRTGSQYLGWSRTNGRNTLPVLAGQEAAKAEKEGVFMALTDDQQKRLVAKVDLVFYAIDKIVLPALGRVERRSHGTEASAKATAASVDAALAEFRKLAAELD